MKNKSIKLLILSAVGLLGLTACNETVVAKPTNYNDPLVEVNDYTTEIYHNLQSVVEDSVHEDGIGSEVLNQILYLYAVNAYGAYDRNVIAGGVSVKDDEVTLLEAINDDAKMNQFVKAHKVYWDAERGTEKLAEDADATNAEKERVKTKVGNINDRIARAMYDKISAGSYSDRHYFSESELLKSLYTSLESVANPYDSETEVYDDILILPDVEPEDVFGNYLHKANYYSDTNRYIIDRVLPDIYRQLLNELYLNTETYNTLGRSYARKVNIVKFKDTADYPNAAYYLANHLVSKINAAPDSYNLDDAEGSILTAFKRYSKAYVGVDTSSDVKAIYNKIVATVGEDEFQSAVTSKSQLEYYKGTSYGDLAVNYEKIYSTNPATATSASSSFTESNSYPTYIGLQQKVLSLRETDNTYNGWYIKNGGLTDLPEAIRNRLFNIAVATGVKETEDEREEASRTYSDGKWKEATNESAYVARINGHNYLKKASRVKGDSIEKDILHYDASSNTYYIVEIEEAASYSKLNKASHTNYANTRGASVMEDIINNVSEIVSKDESYSTLATKKYLKEMVISYHDQSVYDYFYSNYPELF